MSYRSLEEDLDPDYFDPCNLLGGDLQAWEDEQVFQDGVAEMMDPDFGDAAETGDEWE